MEKSIHSKWLTKKDSEKKYSLKRLEDTEQAMISKGSFTHKYVAVLKYVVPMHSVRPALIEIKK